MDRDRHGPVPVEVVDDDPAEDRDGGAGPAPGTPGGTAGTAGPAARSPARRWWVVALLGALVVGLVGAARASAEADRRDDDDVARLAGRSGFTASLREPLEELWRAPGRLVGAGAGVVVLAGGGRGPAQLVGRDAATGRVLWSAAWASPADVLRCGEAAGMLLCEVAGFGYGSPNTDEMLGEVPGRLLVVDPTAGAVVEGRSLDGRTVGWSVADDDVVVARRDGAHLEVVRHRVPLAAAPSVRADAEPVWTVRLPLPEGVTANQLALRVDHGAVVVEGVVGAVLGARDGAVLVPPLQADEPGLPVRVEASPAGALVWRDGRSATWFDRSVAPRPGSAVAGGPVAEAADDGSAPEVALVDRDGLLAGVDVRSGAVLWERPEAAWRRVALVDGTVLVVEPGSVARLDATTGEERWSRPVPGASTTRSPGPGALLLDARRVLLGTALTGGPPVTAELDGGVQPWVGPVTLRGVLRPGTGAAVLLTVDDATVAGWGPDPR